MPLELALLLEAIDDARPTIAKRDTFVVGDEWYGVRQFFSAARIQKAFEGKKPKVAFAEDDCGNYFLVAKSDGRVWFWDHETGRQVQLSKSLSEFLSSLQAMPPIEIKPGQVIESWVDPEFRKSLQQPGS